MSNSPELIKWHSPQPIAITTRQPERQQELMTLLREKVVLPEALDDFEPFFFRVEASNQNLDSYFTRMSESTLANFAEDAKSGISFNQSHNGWNSVGFGRSLDAELKGAKGNKRLEIDFYTIRGLASGTLTSDQFINGALVGIYRDVSVGFTPGYFECSICGGDPMDWFGECDHYPGLEYKNENGRGTKTAFAWIHEGRLNETSVVYDGATPGAGILAIEKARMARAHGKLSERRKNLLEARYRINIPDPEKSWRGVEIVGKRTSGVAGEELVPETPATDELEFLDTEETEEPGLVVEPVRSTETEGEGESAETETEDTVITEAEETVVPGFVAPEVDGRDKARWQEIRTKYEGSIFKSLGSDPIRAVEALASQLTKERIEAKENKPFIEYGRAYITDLKESCHTEGIRALGDKYDRARAERTLGLMSAEEIKALRDQYALLAGDRFQGGRVTRDVTETDEETEEINLRPVNRRNIV